MTNKELSNTFTTLLNSYNTQAQFGEQASKREIVLDEYEKSVLLTQAQDIIVKSYFDATLNQQGQGFDDSTRRQIDFSSLIKVAELEPYIGTRYIKDWNDGNGYLGTLYITNRTSAQIEVTLRVSTTEQTDHGIWVDYAAGANNNPPKITIVINPSDSSPSTSMTDVISDIRAFTITVGGKSVRTDTLIGITLTKNPGETPEEVDYTLFDVTLGAQDEALFDDRGMLFKLPRKLGVDGKEIAGTTEVLFILNEKLSYTPEGKTKATNYVIVPISYKEYDREMSKPYAQPLKKQAWRLFQNTSVGFDLNSELIPRWNIAEEVNKFSGNIVYKIRYVKRPKPIILEDMPDEDLEIDGYTSETPCELNPILHMDILNKAVELAIATRGGGGQANSQPNR